MLSLLSLFYCMEDLFCSSLSIKKLIFDSEMSAYITGVDTPNLNPFIIRKQGDEFEWKIQQGCDFYKENNVRWFLNIPEYLVSKAVELIFEENGLVFEETSRALFIDLDSHNFKSQKDWDNIKPMDHDLIGWVSPLQRAFEASPEVSFEYFKAHERAVLDKGAIHHFSYWDKDQCVGSLSLSKAADIARIDDVGVHPSYQQRGIGSKMIQYVLEKAKDRGVKYCFLEANNVGNLLYEKIGFELLFTNKIYSKAK